MPTRATSAAAKAPTAAAMRKTIIEEEERCKVEARDAKDAVIERRLAALEAELSPSVPVLTLALDVGDREGVKALLSELPATFTPRVLINAAGGALGLNAADTACLDDWETMISANVSGLVYVTHTLLPAMVAGATRSNPAHVVNIGSVAGTYPYPGGNVYGGTKAFVDKFSLNLRGACFSVCAAPKRQRK